MRSTNPFLIQLGLNHRMTNGKGSKRRPKLIDQQTWDKNYERVFGKNSSTKSNKIRKK